MFRLFGFAHFAGLALTLFWAYLLSILSAKNARLNHIFSVLFGSIILSFYFIFAGLEILNGNFSVQYHLPLQISNFILFFVGMSLIFDTKFFYTLAVFWACPGAIISIAFPDINRTFPNQDYVYFWLSHAILLGFVIFLFNFRDYVLTFKDLLLSQVALLCYVTIVYPLNLILGSNYGYLISLPGSVTLPVPFTNPSHYIPLLFVALSLFAYGTLCLHRFFKETQSKSISVLRI